MLAPWKKTYDQPTRQIKRQRHHLADKGLSSQSYGFSSSHIWMWEWTIKKAKAKELMLLNCGVGQDYWESLDCKEVKPINPKGNQSWICIRRTEAEAESPILWPPDVKSRLVRKDPDSVKDWRQEEKEMTEDEMVMVGWHCWCDAHEFEKALGDGEGQGSLMCCSPWGHKEWDTDEWLNWTEHTHIHIFVCCI